MPWELAKRRTISTICRSYGAGFWSCKIAGFPGLASEGPSMEANDLYGSNVTLTDVNPEMTMSIPFW
jgi:hypothetical protein